MHPQKPFTQLASLSRIQNDIALNPVYFQAVSLEKFIELYATHKADMQSVQVIPPRICANGFGHVLIRWKNPVYTMTELTCQANE